MTTDYHFTVFPQEGADEDSEARGRPAAMARHDDRPRSLPYSSTLSHLHAAQ